MPYFKFADASQQILDESELKARDTFGSIQTLSTVGSNLVEAKGGNWPFVTLPHFESWVGGLNLELSGAYSLTFVVIVLEEQRAAWNNYSATHAEQWIQDSLDQFQAAHRLEIASNGTGLLETADVAPELSALSLQGLMKQRPLTEYIWKFDNSGDKRVPDNESQRYAVSWQTTPVDPAGINFNDMSVPSLNLLINEMERLQRPVLSDISFNKEAGSHESYLLQPVFKETNANGTKTLAGYFKASLPWAYFFRGLLPKGKEGIRVIVQSSCNQTLTYELNGAEVTLVGDGDLHDPAFDELAVEASFDPLGNLEGSSYQTEGCMYTLQVFPSVKFQQSYATNKPVIYAAGGVFIILCTAFVFLVYDCFVRRRQRRIVSTATRSNAIVNSLFPANIRDRLLDKESPNQDIAKIRKPFVSKIFNSLVSQNKSSEQNEKQKTQKSLTRLTKPIADLFPATTVMFADIVGFTAWSSVREPSQVFTLLETLYDSFDQIGKSLFRRGIDI